MERKVIYNGFVPVLQNRVYENQQEALHSPKGELRIVLDETNRLIHNEAFESEKMVYDAFYDNTVVSQVFLNYYDSIIDYLHINYPLHNGVVLDIGCGKGTFLKRLCGRIPLVSGVGIDPSYEALAFHEGPQVQFINEYFKESHLDAVPKVSLIVLRHTLEHIPNPSAFLESIFEIIKLKYPNEKVPVFIEVPDFEWIEKEGAFWDFCYEHTNYFTEESLGICLKKSNAQSIKIQKAFHGQYLWAECVIDTHSSQLQEDGMATWKPLDIPDFYINIERMYKAFSRLKEDSKVVVWGMATKGVILSFILQANGTQVDYAVDMNVNKQDKFAPLSGLKIIKPESLPLGEKLSILVMNPNYFNEIKDFCVGLKLHFRIYNINELIK